MENKVKKLIKKLEAENKVRYERVKIGGHTGNYKRLLTHKHNYTSEIIQQLKNCL
jgi:hypothetical protein|tara:strand:- start:417 stop:581 length:165 start_codon:yes stop_codon:yes gene_type:complete